MLVDITKTALENMLALLNATNGTEYTADDVTFGPPQAYSDAEHPGYNTKVSLTGTGDYNGVMEIFYTRLDLDKEIIYRNYESGAFDDVPAFLAHVATLNAVREDNIRLEIDYIPSGSGEVETRLLPSVDSWLYLGQRTIVFKPAV